MGQRFGFTTSELRRDDEARRARAAHDKEAGIEDWDDLRQRQGDFHFAGGSIPAGLFPARRLAPMRVLEALREG